MIKTTKTQRTVPSYVIDNFEYSCDICNLVFQSKDKAIDHHIFNHIEKMDIPGVGTAYLLMTGQDAHLFWKAYKQDNDLRFIDEDKVTIIPGTWHMVFMEERPFRNEHDEWYWIAPLTHKIPILVGEKANLLEEISAIDRAIKEIYETTN